MLIPDPLGSVSIGGGVTGSVVVTGSQNIILQAGQVLLQAAQAAQQQGRDPAHMLRLLALLAAPVHDPRQPDHPPAPLNLRAEWRRLEQAVTGTRAPILLARLAPPTLGRLRRELSPRVAEQGLFPHVLHFSGHAWTQGLLLEDENGQTHFVTARELLKALQPPRPLDLVVLNACETAAEATSAAQALVDAGLARAVVGHPRPVWDDQAIAFARTLYADLTDGYALAEAVARGGQHITTHQVIVLGDRALRFDGLARGEPLVLDARPRGNLPPGDGVGFFGRGAELVNLAGALDRPPCLTLITGPAGIGKSRLALEAAHRNAWRFPGGVAYADAPREAATADYLVNSLAQALGLEVSSEARVAEVLLAYLHANATLLVLDNLESLPEAELRRLAAVLERLGGPSAAIAALRPPLPVLEDTPHAVACPVQTGLQPDAAMAYALRLAAGKGLRLEPAEAAEIAQATAGHPLLIARIVAQARRRDRQALLAEVRRHAGDFAGQIEALYAWSAERINAAGQQAWRALPLFPAGWLPEAPLRRLAGAEGAASLREAAVADFDPHLQGWRWHPTVAEYAARRWPLGEAERTSSLEASLPGWTAWLEGLREVKDTEAHNRLEAALPNLETLIAHVGAHSRAPYGRASLADTPLRRFLRVMDRMLLTVAQIVVRRQRNLRRFLRALDDVLPAPDRTLALRPFLADFYHLKADLAQDEAGRARALLMLGYALSALGRREEALAAAQEAADLYRQLAQAQPQAFLPALAMSLNNLGAMLSALGRREEALAAAQEAADLYRGLAHAQPQAFLPDLAGSLNNLGAMLSDLGRREEALAATQEAADLYRQLAQAQPQAFLTYLAISLNNLGDRLAEMRRPAEALAAYAEAVRTLAPFFLRLPAAFADRMDYMVRDYLAACEAAGQEPDEALIRSIQEAL